MTDRSVRNLAHLRRSASTARVLNLIKVEADSRGDPRWRERPLFRHPTLNRALVIKHRLRRNELDLMPYHRQVATKVVIPIDVAELKQGGRWFFVDETLFERLARENFGLSMEDPDIRALRQMDALPSLDPFLLREQLRRIGHDPAPCYFALSEADMARMAGFVEREVAPLIRLTMEQHDDVQVEYSARRLRAKILSNSAGQQMEALRATLRLEAEQYEEGVFCWKGFLYYKWVLTSLLAEAFQVSDAVTAVRPVGPLDAEARAYLDRGRQELRGRIARVCDDVARTLKVYDDAYEALIGSAQPLLFRDFLLRAPALFTRLGEQLGAVQHITSFWRFRFGPNAAPVSPEELIDIFMDFEIGLRGREEVALETPRAA